MHSRARLAVAARPGFPARTAITRLRSDGPCVLRQTIARRSAPILGWDLVGSGAAWVSRAAGAAGPLGGDDLRLEVDIGPSAALVLHDVSASLALPGAHREPSISEVVVRVGAGATFVWLPQPLIAADRCHHRSSATIELAPGARALVREELWLGRHGEAPGSIRQRLRVCLGQRAIYDQEIAAGPAFPGWEGPAVTGGRRALGAILLVDPMREPNALPAARDGRADCVCLPLDGSGLAISAVGDDGLAVRCRLDAALAELAGSWPRAVEIGSSRRVAGQSGLVSWPRAKSPKSSTSSSRGSVC